MKIKLSKCNCGDPICNKYFINHSGLFEREDAEHIKKCVDLHYELLGCCRVFLMCFKDKSLFYDEADHGRVVKVVEKALKK